MAFLRSVRTLREGLGSLGTQIWRTILDIGTGLAGALGLGRKAGVEAEPVPTWHEGYQVSVAAGRQEDFSAVESTAYVPVDWYEISTIPWDKPIAYTVAVYGRSRITTRKYKPGQMARMEFDLTFSRPLTMEEVRDEATAWLTGKDYSPFSEAISITVIGASRREGEPWRW